MLEGDGIEITFKDNAVNNGTINGKAQIENFNNTSSDVLNKILEEINNLKIRLNP